MNKKMNFKKIFNNVITIIAIIVLIWFVLSYIEIISKNLSLHPQYSKFNVIVNLITKMGER